MIANPFKIFLPISMLIIWVVLISLFGFTSHFSIAGASLFIQGLSIYIYENLKSSKQQKIKLFSSSVGILFSVINIINSFYLESTSIAFKILVILFGLVCIYVFGNMLKVIKNHKLK